MISRHSQRTGVSARTDPEVRDAANAVLEERGWNLKQFIVAALKAVAVQPDQMLKFLEAHRPPERPRGRPKAE